MNGYELSILRMINSSFVKKTAKVIFFCLVFEMILTNY